MCVINRKVVTYLFAFEEAQSVDVILYVLPQLFLDGFPCVAKVVHFLGTLQLHGGTSLETNTCAFSQSLYTFTQSGVPQHTRVFSTLTLNMPVSSLLSRFA